MNDMETRIRQLEITTARQEVVMQGVVKVVEDNTSAIKELTAALNKGRGVLWFVGATGLTIGGTLGTIFSFFKG